MSGLWCWKSSLPQTLSRCVQILQRSAVEQSRTLRELCARSGTCDILKQSKVASMLLLNFSLGKIGPPTFQIFLRTLEPFTVHLRVYACATSCCAAIFFLGNLVVLCSFSVSPCITSMPSLGFGHCLPCVLATDYC